MKKSTSILRLFWYGAGFYLVLSYLQVAFVNKLRPHTFVEWILLFKAVLGLLLLASFFVVVDYALRSAFVQSGISSAVPRKTVDEADDKTGDKRFPSPSTIFVGKWLLIFTTFLTLGLFFILNSFCWPDWIKKCLETAPDITNALASMFGAGIGSMIATILGYLEHASEEKDFEEAYVPWYINRPIMGMLLGLVFYFLLRDGLLAVINNKAQPEDLSIAGLAGVGALVGLFSKEAIEKLRELFNTLFSTKKSAEKSFLDRLPADLREQVKKHVDKTDAPNPKQSPS